jgi:signal transduction histidine kinase
MKIFISHPHRKREAVTTLVEILKKQGHEVLEPSNKITSGDSLSSVSTLILSADIIVAVLTDQDPNVYYELGVATGAGKSILVLASTGEELPSDLSAIPFIQTSGNIMQDAQTISRRLIDFHIYQQPSIKKYKSVNETLLAASSDPNYLDLLTPMDFENLLADWFRERGYTVNTSEVPRNTGYDFSIVSESQSGVILVEVKKMRRQSRVSVEVVKQLLSLIRSTGAIAGLVISTSGYTSSANALAISSSVALRTLDDLFKAKSEEELLSPGVFNPIGISKNIHILEDIINPVIKTLRERFLKANVDITMQGFDKIPPISIDPIAIRNVVSLLLENAVKYSPKGGVVKLQGEIIKEYVEFRFVNHATALIHASERDLIFQKGYRGQDAVLKEPVGMGLGLYTVNNLVRAHNGEIIMEFDGHMVVVKMRLPLRGNVLMKIEKT